MEKIVGAVGHKRIPRAKSDNEQQAWQHGQLLCGVDEVGRGCLAGPVVVAAVVLYPDAIFDLLKDSKLLDVKQRVRAARWIHEHSWHAYGVASNREIDHLNIYRATQCAMKRAIAHVCTCVPHLPAKIIIDAMPISFGFGALAHIPVEYFARAEQQSISVAAASILAKVKRDALMNEFDSIFPGYALAQHKGYATAQHCQSVTRLGSSIIHREGFVKTVFDHYEKAYGRQIDLFCGSY